MYHHVATYLSHIKSIIEDFNEAHNLECTDVPYKYVKAVIATVGNESREFGWLKLGYVI